MADSDLDLAHRVLAGPKAGELVRAGLGQLGQDPGPLDVSVERVYHRPDAEATVGYRARRHGGRDLFVVATTAPVGHNVARVELDGFSFTLWPHPHDPKLPSLALASRPSTVARWLAQAGERLGADKQVRLRLLSYRPLRRAVLCAAAGERRWFLKLARRKAFEALVTRQRLLADAGLSPMIVDEPAPGVLIMDQAPGSPLARALAEAALDGGDASALPRPDDFELLLDALPSQLMELRSHHSWSERADFHGLAAAQRLPVRAGEIRELAARIIEGTAATSAEPSPAHGDFHEANVFLVERRPVAVIDVDAAGPGQRVDDLACLVGHLAVLEAGGGRRVPSGLAERWALEFERRQDRSALAIRVAGVVLTLVAGAPSAQAGTRLALAQRWAERAEGCGAGA